MLSNLQIIAFVAIAIILLSSITGWAFGRFANRAKAPEVLALPVAEPAGQIDRFVETQTCEHPDTSGIALISENSEAFTSRVMLARAAQRSLDLMYYTWNEDLTGRLLMLEVLAAADRGVRVRLLLDDIGVSIRDEAYRALNAHPLIEIRLFNPTRARKGIGDARPGNRIEGIKHDPENAQQSLDCRLSYRHHWWSQYWGCIFRRRQ